jgi:hypothetical protein
MKTYRLTVEHIETRREVVDVDADSLTSAAIIGARYADGGVTALTSNDRRRVRIYAPRDASQVTRESYVISAKEVG